MRSDAPTRATTAGPWVASLSALVTALAMVTMRLSQLPGDSANPALDLPESVAAVAIASALTWISVRLRLPLLMPVSALIALGSTGAAHELAMLGTIVSSHSLLARTRFFRATDGRWSRSFLATCSGWLAAFGLLLALGLEDRIRRHEPAWPVALPGTAALIFGLLALVPGRAARAAESVAPASSEGSRLSAFSAGFGCFFVGFALVIGVVLSSGDFLQPGGSGSLRTPPEYLTPQVPSR